MKDWAQALIATALIVGLVLWSARVFIGVIYG